MADAPLLVVDRLTKSFAGVRVLNEVSLEVAPGEIVSLVGQNGSGKSTLVKCLAGLLKPDSGEYRLGVDAEGRPAAAHFIHQDLGLVPSLSAVENMSLTRRVAAGGLGRVRRAAERRKTRDLLAQIGCTIDVDRPVAELSAAERSMVAIARALDGWAGPANVLVLDEPTAALPRDEVAGLFAAVRRVADRGAGVVFVSHRLDEVLSLSHRIVALRDGVIVDAERADAVSHDRLIQMIVGRAVDGVEKARSEPGDVVARIRGVAGGNVRGVDLDLRAGEVVGVAGTLGSGREHLGGLVFGAVPRSAGTVEIGGTTVPASPRDAIRAGFAFVPEDRRRHGAVMTMALRENITLAALRPVLTGARRLSRRRELADAVPWIRSLEIRPDDPDRPLTALSGGNQQKAVLAKWLRLKPRVLLLDEPSQGVDVGAKAAIYRQLREAAEAGMAVLMSSSDSYELATVCDRVLVLQGGVVVAELIGDRVSEPEIIRAGLHSLEPVPA